MSATLNEPIIRAAAAPPTTDSDRRIDLTTSGLDDLCWQLLTLQVPLTLLLDLTLPTSRELGRLHKLMLTERSEFEDSGTR